MCLKGLVLDYPFAEVLLLCTENGYEVDCGDNWTKEQIEAAFQHGPHTLEKTSKAAMHVWEKAIEKEEKEYYAIIK